MAILSSITEKGFSLSKTKANKKQQSEIPWHKIGIALMCILLYHHFQKLFNTIFTNPPEKKASREEKAKENKLERKQSFSQNEISAADFSSPSTVECVKRSGKKGKSIFVECQVLSYDKMKWVWDGFVGVRWVWLMARGFFSSSVWVFCMLLWHYLTRIIKWGRERGKTGKTRAE